MATFLNEDLNKKENVIEKVHYLGDLRIVGTVSNGKQTIGYVIMQEKTKKFKMYTIEQTKVLLQKFKFVNAELVGNKIINTECSMDRLFIFDTNMRVVDNPGIMIIGEIIEDNKKVGYRVMDVNASIIDLPEEALLKLVDYAKLSTSLINAKVVTGNGSKKPYISAIKTEFTKIEKEKVEVKTSKPKKDTPESRWRKEKHAYKLEHYLLPKAIKWGLRGKYADRYRIVNDYLLTREQVDSDHVLRYFDYNKETQIIVKEILSKYDLTDNDKALLSKIVKNMPHSERLDTNGHYYESEEDKLYIFALAQFQLCDTQWCNEILNKRIKIRYIDNTEDGSVFSKGLDTKYAEKLKELGYASDKLIKATTYLTGKKNKELRRLSELSQVKVENESLKMFDIKTFTSAGDIAQLGFAITEANRGYKFVTETGFNKTLLYIGDVFINNRKILDENENTRVTVKSPEEDGEKAYSRYKEVARCLGDLACVAYIDKLLTKVSLTHQLGKSSYLPEQQIAASIEMIIAIAYIYGSESVHRYVEDNYEGLLSLGIEEPDFDELSTTDYKLSQELKMYYSSGFNVFLSDSNAYRYRKDYLRDAELINYRQLGISHNIKHPMLQGELASVVNMVTSEKNCPSTLVEKYIGQLRFL
jgi:hypothetical protein